IRVLFRSLFSFSVSCKAAQRGANPDISRTGPAGTPSPPSDGGERRGDPLPTPASRGEEAKARSKNFAHKDNTLWISNTPSETRMAYGDRDGVLRRPCARAARNSRMAGGFESCNFLLGE